MTGSAEMKHLRQSGQPALSGSPKLQTSQTLDFDEIVVGKDVLELVSSAMYVDPLSIYREYVQNAADSIDDARRAGILGSEEPGRVEMDFDQAARSVRIRDNGTGIARPDFVRRLTALGGSVKRGTKARGFRGVGRLAGLGYAQELIFRSKSREDGHVSELRWDCRRLKSTLREASLDGGLHDLVRSIVSVSTLPVGDYPDHFLEVELKGVVRLRGDKLMSPATVADYLSQVAPVPFSPEFSFASEIGSALEPVLGLGEIEIRVDGAGEPLYRPHRDTFQLDERRTGSFDRLEVVHVPGMDGGSAAVAWVLHHGYDGALPTASGLKGMRLRVGNVQVGDHALLEDIFPEPRFNVWSVGEVHVVDRRIVPNGRRDHFEQNGHFHNLTNQLTPVARNIARQCRTNSQRRKLLRDFEILRVAAEEKIGIIAQGGVGEAERSATALSVEQGLMQMRRVAGTDLLVQDAPETVASTIKELEDRLAMVMGAGEENASPLSRLPPERREMYEHLFELVYACSTNRSAAKALIDRILMKVA